ncbi:uncharacterized protein PRCAT00000307001 [Priceomyces carsonii]|uniref:uncharacterized protein n=1 Tax=Priceomyces carsonii TaxID=28549 RepID=UPI002ED7744A|nr:unnamed protein product [Priceomyces carsonii]
MESLLSDRATRKIGALEFATTVAESCYTILGQNVGPSVFPSNCHYNAAVNGLSLEQHDFQYLLSASADSSIKLWDIKNLVQNEATTSNKLELHEDMDLSDDNQKRTFVNLATVPRKSVHNFGISCIQWWPFDTGMFISSSFDHTVKIWDTNQMLPVHSFDLDHRVYSIDMRGDETNSMNASALVAVASDHQFIRLLDLRSASSAHTLGGHKGKALCVKWHPRDPNLLASGGFDGEVKVWDIRRSKSCLCRLDMLRTSSQNLVTDNLTKLSVKAHLGPVNGLVWDQSGNSLITAGNDDKVRVWDMVLSLAPPLNKLINFGPLTRNKYTQSIPLVLSSKYESELQYLLFPSDNSDIFVFRTIDGKMVSRLSRKGSKNIGRTTSMVHCGPFLSSFLCGTVDGEIISWSPKWKAPDISSLFYDPYEDKNARKVASGAIREQLEKEARHILETDPYFK